MLSKNKPVNRDKLETIIGLNTEIDGNIKLSGTVLVNGKINGDVSTSGDVHVGEKARIKGSVSGVNIQVAGRVEGNITTTGLLRLLSSAKIKGNISIKSFVSDEGAVFNGKCIMCDTAAAAEINDLRGFIEEKEDKKDNQGDKIKNNSNNKKHQK